MRILVFGINYSPDLTGIGKYTGEMCSYLAAKGHEITMVTAHPYYPRWELQEGYPRYFWKKEVIDGVTVERCPLYIPNNPSALKKILHEISFMGSIFPIWTKYLFKKKYDYVFCINPPFHLTLYPLFYKWIRGSKLVSHVQDLQVDVVNDMELIRSAALVRLMFVFEKFYFDHSDMVSTISFGMERKISEKGIPRSKQWMFPNWVDTDFIKPLSKAESLRERFGLKVSDQVVLYSGNIGEKQGLESLLEIAFQFKNQPNVQFVIVGSGGARKRLEQAAADMELDNIRFFSLQPYEDLPKLLAVADLHLVLQKKEASDLVMPSKLTGILAAGGLALITASADTTLYDIIKKHEMGILIEPGNSIALYEGIKTGLSMMDSERLRVNARNYAISHLSKVTLLDRLERKLKEGLGWESAPRMLAKAET